MSLCPLHLVFAPPLARPFAPLVPLVLRHEGRPTGRLAVNCTADCTADRTVVGTVVGSTHRRPARPGHRPAAAAPRSGRAAR
ncbi:hypothetical protein ACWGH2_05475 [Streptomyces sp. NPDC054871]